MRTGRWAWGTASLVALVACGDIWGFHDLTTGTPDAALVFDATALNVPDVTQEASPVVDSGTSEAEAVDGPADDGGPTDDAISPEDAGDATVDAAPGDAADASTPEAATADAEVEAGPEAAPPNDAAADVFAACQAICAGCCDSTGHCELGTSVSVCGVSGALCQTCANESCSILTATQCCKSNGTCGCEGLVGGCN